MIWVNGNAFGALKCWKENSFMDLVEMSMKEESGQHVHGWENVTLVKEAAVLRE